jgi:hypothetical protein
MSSGALARETPTLKLLLLSQLGASAKIAHRLAPKNT